MAGQIYTPHHQCLSIATLHPHQHLALSVVFILAILVGMFMLWYLIVVLTFFSLIINKGEHFLIYVFSIDVCFPSVAL